MTLDNLLGKSLEAIEPDASGIARLLEAAQASLADARLPNLHVSTWPTRRSCRRPTRRCKPMVSAR